MAAELDGNRARYFKGVASRSFVSRNADTVLNETYESSRDLILDIHNNVVIAKKSAKATQTLYRCESSIVNDRAMKSKTVQFDRCNKKRQTSNMDNFYERQMDKRAASHNSVCASQIGIETRGDDNGATQRIYDDATQRIDDISTRFDGEKPIDVNEDCDRDDGDDDDDDDGDDGDDDDDDDGDDDDDDDDDDKDDHEDD